MRLRLVVGLQVLQWALLGTLARAQEGAQPLPELPPPPPAAESAPASQPPPAAPEGGAEACVPPCRSGFMCQRGVCISACNPPCPAGQQCTPQGECIYPYVYPQQQMYPAAPLYPPPSPAMLQRPAPPPPPPGSYEHDGFLLRGGFGIGFTATEQSPSRANTSFLDSNFTGVAMALNVDVGYAPVTNFVLQARFGFMITPDPRISVEGSDDTVSGEFSLGTLLLAPALTYYFMPINLYITGAVGLAWFTFDSDRVYDYDDYDDNTDATSAGIGLNLDVGKEWWVGRQWGIGVAARMNFAAATGEVVSGRYDYTQWGFAILFSATMQ